LLMRDSLQGTDVYDPATQEIDVPTLWYRRLYCPG
jgi:hypothetical protein